MSTIKDTQSADPIIAQMQSYQQHSDQSTASAQPTRYAHRFSSPLGSRLRERLVPTNKESSSHFLPANAIAELITEETIKEELRSHQSEKVSRHAVEWAAQIVAPCHNSKTGRRKILGLLSMILRVDLIEGFIGSKCDCDLPFTKEDLPLGDTKTKEPCAYEFLRGELLEYEIESLMAKQWLFLVPVFRREDANEPIPNLPNSTIFPFWTDETTRSVHCRQFATVRKVKFHSAHFVDGKAQSMFKSRVTSDGIEPSSSNIGLCAIKELHRYTDEEYEGQYAAACKKEIHNLLRVRNIPQDYLIELLFAYIYRNSFYLVFPWADRNLRDFWKEEYPNPAIPVRDESLARWVFQQSYRLVQAINFIHGHGADTRPSKDGAIIHNTHGNITPENILWFKGSYEPGKPTNLGQFKIDFEGVRFHYLPYELEADELPYHGSYQAPVTGMGDIRAQSDDIWSLGCVLLEFVTWHLHGWKGVDDFSKSRAGDRDPHLPRSAVQDDDFFLLRYEKLRTGTWKSGDRIVDSFFHWPTKDPEQQFLARFKCSVKTHFDQLYRHSNCSQFSTDFLQVIENCLLRLNRGNRMSIDEIGKQLDRMKLEGDKHPGYWTETRGTPIRANTNLSELIPERRPYYDKQRSNASGSDYETHDYSEIESIASKVFTDISAPSTISSQIDESELAIRELAKFLQQDDIELAPLFRAAIQSVGLERFERNVAKLLAGYSRNLRKEASPGSQYHVSSFIWRCRLRTAQAISVQLNATAGSVPRTLDLDTIVDYTARVNEWINSQTETDEHERINLGDTISTPTDVLEIIDIVGDGEVSESDDTESDGPNDAPVNALGEVKAFLRSAQATQTLRAELRRWLKLDTEDQKFQELQDNQEIHEVQNIQNQEDQQAHDFSQDKQGQEHPNTELQVDDEHYAVLKFNPNQSSLNDRLKRRVECIAGCRLSWWPLEDPGRPLLPGYTRVYSSISGIKFHDDITISSAVSMFPKIAPIYPGDKNTLSKAVSSTAIQLKSTSLLRILADHLGLGTSVMMTNQNPASSSRTQRTTQNAQQAQSGPIGPPGQGVNVTTSISQAGRVSNSSVSTAPVLFLTKDHPRNYSIAGTVELGTDDKLTISSLRRTYSAMCGRWRFWKRPTGVNFFRFEKFHFEKDVKLHVITVHKDKPRYPLDTDDEYPDYVYDPRPWQVDIVGYPSGELWYFFQKPAQCGNSKVLTNSLPARSKGDISESRARAFGIHIEEDFSVWAVFSPFCFFICVTIGLSIWFMPVWLRDHPDDLQGASMPVTLTLAVVTCILQTFISLLVSKWK